MAEIFSDFFFNNIFFNNAPHLVFRNLSPRQLTFFFRFLQVRV